MDSRMRSSKTVSFPEASPNEERVAAILVNKGEDGNLRAYVKDVPGHTPPDPEIVAVLVQAVEIANL